MPQPEVVVVAPVESVTCTPNAKVPATVGVPVMAPVLVFNDRPGGSEPTGVNV